MLNTNIFRTNVKEAQTMEFGNAIRYERLDMEMTELREKKARLEKKIENKNDKYTSEQVVGFISELEALELDLYDKSVARETYKKYHELVVASMTKKEDGKEFGNSVASVRNMLRVLACAENQKLYNYALIPTLVDVDLYEALEQIHVARNNDTIGKDGSIKLGADSKNAYKVACKQLESIMKGYFSIPFSNEYTRQVRVKLNNQDIALLHDCYVTGFNNKIVECKDGSLKFQGRKVNTLCKKDKNGNINMKKLSGVICKLVLEKYAKVVTE